LQAKGDVLADGHVRKEGVALEDGVDGTLVGRRPPHGAPMDIDFALGGQFKAGDHAQRSRLAAAGRAKQRKELAV
jgi:hypothetical protein